jgi:DNA repair exonuclease SbcCD ATPase subunit
MEKGAIYCFAELEREQGGGLILKKPEEKLVFLAKFGYPLWLFPWNELSLIFDGLKTKEYALTYKIVPEVKNFMENLQRSSKSIETYMTFLSDSINFFQISSSEKTMTIAALITEPNFLNEFGLYILEASTIEASPSEMVFLPTVVDESAILSAVQELGNLKSQFKEEVTLLYNSMKFLNKTTRNFAKTLRGKIRAVREEFNSEIEKQKNVIIPKVNSINEEYDELITQMTRNFEKQLLPLQKEKIKYEKLKEQTLTKIERCKMEAKACAANKDAVGERKWKEKEAESRKEFSEIEVKIEELEEKIKELEENKSAETFRLRSEWEAKVKEAQKELLELEASRDAKIQLYKQEIEKLEKQTSTIIEQIDKIAKMRETDISNFEKLGIKQTRTKNALIYIPFYLACYQSESKKRYVLFPPFIVNSVSFLAKIKGAFGKAKVKQLLAPRFKIITSFLQGLLTLIGQYAVFEREINEAGEKADMLKTDLMREKIKNGLEKLKAEGWFSEKEYEAFAEPFSKTPS